MTARPNAISRAGLGLLCAAAGSLSAMSFVIGAEGYVGMSDPPASPASYLWCALALCFALLYWRVYVVRRRRPGIGGCALGLLFGLTNAMGGTLFAYDSWAMLSGAAAMGKALLRVLGQALPMTAFFTWLDGALKSGAPTAPGALDGVTIRRFARIGRFWRAHTTVACMLLLALCWLPYLLAFYPGTVCWDLGEMVAQFFGKYEVDTWHPVFTTWLIGGCVWLGRLLGSDNLGAMLFTLLQTALLSYALSRSVVFLRRLGMKRAIWLSALAFFAVTPLWGGYAQFISKDTLYTAALLLFTLEVLELFALREERAKEIPRRLSAGLFLWGLLSCLLRSNGLYVVLPTAVLAVIFGARGMNRAAPGAALAAAVAGALLFSNALLPALGVRDETASGLYSVCFQQSARVLRDHGNEVTAEEYAEIDRVLEADRLPELYEPWISDPVKFTFRQYGQGAEVEKPALARYRKTWLSMMQKYPLTYAEAFFAGNVSYYAFTPKLEGQTYNDQAGNRLVFETYELGDSRGYDPRFLDTTQLSSLDGARRLLAAFARGWRYLPLVSLLYACATYTWLLVGAGLSLARQRRWRMLVCFVPALLSLGVCLLSPVNDYFRYFLPIVAMTFPLVGVSSARVKKIEAQKPEA